MDRRVKRVIGTLGISGCLFIALAAHAACLSDLAPATRCPADPVYEFCGGRPNGAPSPAPGPGGPGGPTEDGGQDPPTDSCNLFGNDCLLPRVNDCPCTETNQCVRTSSSCYPAPSCPESIRAVNGSAECLEVQAVSTPGPPIGPEGPEEGFRRVCVCGCPSCATVCDGKGPLLGSGRSIRFTLSIASTSGSLGTMIRARGIGGVNVIVDLADGTSRTIGFVPLTPGTAFAEVIARRPDALTYDWSAAPLRPIAMEVELGPEGQAEIDCVVPWVTR